ncbi:MAG: Transcriptional regulator, LysR family [uncultured Sulfurovum sp.]|uniref:Transcriptional regulator, LysR family n=1 Tax=uncultured Sulfurovum sp. TaxID=269237 RepID=A0A6S6SW45_9BACT|nr:MAG: Transcriptional regulator, LysR family [uncultured Sulfurovum sp.]
MMNITKKDKFRIGASHTIATYVLPGELISTIQSQTESFIKLDVAPCQEIIKAVKARKIDIGFVEFETTDDALTCTEWMDEELVLCSKKQLPMPLTKKDLANYTLLCGGFESADRNVLDTFLREQELHRDDFESLLELDNPTAIIQNIKWSNPHAHIPSMALVSKRAIEYELKYNILHISSINYAPILKNFYIVYRNDSQQSETIHTICTTLLEKSNA